MMQRDIGSTRPSVTSWLAKVEILLVCLLGLVVSWQMRHTAVFASLGGAYFEYGSVHIYVSDLIVIALLLLWGVATGYKKIQTGPQMIWWPLLCFLAWQTLSVLWAEDRLSVLWHAAEWWLWAGAYLYLINRLANVRMFVRCLIVGLVLQAGIGVAQYLANSSLGLTFWGESILSVDQGGVPVVVSDGLHRIRAHGLMPHANIFGGWLVVGMGWLFWLVGNRLRPKAFEWFAGAAMALGIALSYSRTAWALLLGAVVIAVTGYWSSREKLWARIAFPLVMLGLGLTMLASQTGWTLGRFDLEERLEQKSVSDRVESWSTFKDVWQAQPILGVGVGNYSRTAASLVTQVEPSWYYPPVHNVYLLTLAELGVVGLGVLVWLVVAIWVWVARQSRGRVGMNLAWAFGVWCLIGLVDHWPMSLHQGWVLAFVALALIILQSRLEYESHSN